MKYRDGRLARRQMGWLAVPLVAAGVLVTAPAWHSSASPWMAGFLTGSAVCAALLAALAWTLRPRTAKRNHEVAQSARELAAGDLSRPAPAGTDTGQPELADALEQVRQHMFRVIARVRLGTASIATTSGMLTADNAALAERTDGQASSLEETASALEQLAATVRQNADNARAASDMMAQTRTSATQGGQVMAQAVESMAAIQARSARVADIISVIDGIAFQTNILALNAAVEAARAGEQGRGFAVVAGEVRSLAQRAAGAAKEVRTLIADSAQEVRSGGQRVGEAGQAMEEIVGNVVRVSQLMGDIAAATAEQSKGLEEVNRAMVQIDGVTQQNAALVQEVARTAAGLQAEAEELTHAVEGFVLGEREFGNQEEAVALVQAGAGFARQHGGQALVDEVNRLGKGRFLDRDLYLSVYRLDGQVAAHGTNRRLRNIDGAQFKDHDGRRFIVDIVRHARSSGSGWIDYKWAHPVTKQVLVKTAYFEKCGDLVIACGFFGSRAPAARRAAPLIPA